LKIDYLPNSGEDHVLFIEEVWSYALPRGVLSDLARTPRGRIEGMIRNFNDSILHMIEQKKVGVDGLHVALCQAYTEEEKRIRETPPPHLGEQEA